MVEISGGPLETEIPDDLTIPQFFLDSHHPRRPVRNNAPWMIDDETGRQIGYEEVRSHLESSSEVMILSLHSKIRTRTFGLANGIALHYGISRCSTHLCGCYAPDSIYV